MKFFSFICGTLMVLLLLAVPLIHGTMSHAQMLATSGGANCKVCPGEANSSCNQQTCTYVELSAWKGCEELSGGTYKVCANGTHPEQNCLNDASVSCGTAGICSLNEGNPKCTSSTYNCTCHSKKVTRTGCA